MVNYLQGLVFFLLLLLGAAVVVPVASANPGAGVLLGLAWVIGDAILSSAVQLAA